MLRMTNAASSQGVEILREKLREFLESSETGRQAIGMSQSGRGAVEGHRLETLNGSGKRVTTTGRDDDDEI